MTKVERSSSSPRTSKDAETLMATLSQRLREAFNERRTLRGNAAEMKAAHHQALSVSIIQGDSKPDRAPLEAVEKEMRDLEEHLLGLTLAIREVGQTRRDLKRNELAAERDGLKHQLASVEEQIKTKAAELAALRGNESGLCWTIRSLQDQIDAPVRGFSPREIKTLEELEALAIDLTFKPGHELMRLLEEFEGTLAQGTVLRVSEKRVNGHLGVEAVPV